MACVVEAIRPNGGQDVGHFKVAVAFSTQEVMERTDFDPFARLAGISELHAAETTEGLTEATAPQSQNGLVKQAGIAENVRCDGLGGVLCDIA